MRLRRRCRSARCCAAHNVPRAFPAPAVDMIDEHLPESLRSSPVWQQVKDMLVTAAETRKGHDVETATALLERALQDEGLSPPETQTDIM